MTPSFDIGLGLENSHVLITGSSGHIGSIVVQAFLEAGCFVSALDIKEPTSKITHDRLFYELANTTNESQLEQAFEKARKKFGVISICIALAGLDLSYLSHHESICDMPLDQWKRTFSVNCDGTFLTCRTWLRGIKSYATSETKNLSCIVIGSEAAQMGVRSNVDYSSSKSAIQVGFVKSLAPDVVRIHPNCRINAIAPGPVDTLQFRKECEEDPQAEWVECIATVATGKAVPMEAVARSCLFLASDRYSGSICGQVIPVDGGKSGKLFWLPDGKSV